MENIKIYNPSKTHISLKKTPRVIMVIDRPGWSYHNIVSQIINTYGSNYDFDVMLSNNAKNESCDLMVVFNWADTVKIVCENKCNKVALCVYDNVTWHRTDYDKRRFDFAYSKVDYIIAANNDIVNNLKICGYSRKPIFLCEDGVDINLFRPTEMPREFTVGWCGNSLAGRGKIKGLEIIKKACEKCNVRLKTKDIKDGPSSYKNMPAFYSDISVYCNMSIAEGTPNPPLEAMASGKPVITTNVGIMNRLVIDGVNGFYCNRDVDELAVLIDHIMKDRDIELMGEMARLASELHQWKIKLLSWNFALIAMCAR